MSKLFTIHGRIDRLEFFATAIGAYLVGGLMLWLLPMGLNVAGWLFSLFVVWVAAAKRAHDLNRSAWWAFIPALGYPSAVLALIAGYATMLFQVPLLSAVLLFTVPAFMALSVIGALLLLVWPGTNGVNSYGAPLSGSLQ